MQRTKKKTKSRAAFVRSDKALTVMLGLRRKVDISRLVLPVRQRRHLNVAQTADAFSPDAADISAVRRYARAQGLKCIEVSLAGATIVLSGTVAQFNRAFGVKLVHRRDKKYSLPYLSHDEDVTIPAELKAVITGVFGLDTRPASRRPHRLAHAMSTETIAPPPSDS